MLCSGFWYETRTGAILLIPFSSPAQEATAGLTVRSSGYTGAYIPHAAVELDSGAKKYQVSTDDAGVYQFSNLPRGRIHAEVRVPRIH